MIVGVYKGKYIISKLGNVYDMKGNALAIKKINGRYYAISNETVCIQEAIISVFGEWNRKAVMINLNSKVRSGTTEKLIRKYIKENINE
jgi:hypothetical protein